MLQGFVYVLVLGTAEAGLILAIVRMYTGPSPTTIDSSIDTVARLIVLVLSCLFLGAIFAASCFFVVRLLLDHTSAGDGEQGDVNGAQ